MHVQCKGEDALVGRVINGQAAISIDFSDFNLTVQITELQVDDIVQQSSKIGDHDLHPLANFINVGAYIVLPIVNSMIPVVEIPSLIDGIKIE
eukprot:NODE_5248_length_591_cov_72.053506_g4542_i0.p1 GENE.NODE_5248_length_591_cov_72.053506_g4542_i0~~NODE_5248_length_591_cov_72.053506_g4542_i0.p1  ORF type:complete len:93 (-),score=5.14 NODE_5248_length_591_cov_72.053506_g4542_i0:170-448(-)